MLRTFLAITVALFAGSAFAQPQAKVVAGVLEGTFVGDPAISAYRGVPFARPPLGELRWKAPQPVESWRGVRPAKSFAPLCVQRPYPPGNFWEYLQPPVPQSEDCLYLNVWTAAKPGERRPVMVWIHGGGMIRGAGSLAAYDGEGLARKGVVVVTVNYRLGVLGYFAHPALTAETPHHASGNYGLLDQIAALQWVRDNIAAFGGDPAKVTIFGESAGAQSVNMLMASPRAAGLFRAAIGQSGSGFGTMKSLAAEERVGLRYGDDIAALRAKPAQDVLETIPYEGFGPNVDGYVFRESVLQTFQAGRQHKIPVLVGWNADEVTTLQAWPEGGNRRVYETAVRQSMGRFADDMLVALPAETDVQAKAAYFAFWRDIRFGWPAKAWARLQRRAGQPAYLYHFARVPAGPAGAAYGAFHSAEIPYVFQTQGRVLSGWDETDRRLSDLMSDYWVAFARKGDPNAPGLPRWPVYDEAADVALEFGDMIVPRAGINRPVMQVIDRYVPSLPAVTP